MGAIAVYLLEHGKQLIAWAAILAAVSALLYGIYNSTLWTGAAEIAVQVNHVVVESVQRPASIVASIEDAIFSVAENSTVRFAYWLFGLSGLVEVLGVLSATCLTIMSLAFTVIVAAAALGAVIWTYRLVVRWAGGLSTGDARSGNVFDT